MKGVKRFLSRAVVAGLTATAVLAPAVALAQSEAPPQPNLRTYAPVWLGYGIIVVLLVVVIVVSLMPSKRGHQD
jgi:FtsH-binding integral membrane protein